jgi:hypothetical protein
MFDYNSVRGYWPKIRIDLPLEEEVCQQIKEGKVNECDKYLLARACVRKGYIQAYRKLSVLPEVNIIVEAYVRNTPLFDELSRAENKYVAMNDHERSCFAPREVSEWYNTDMTDTSVRGGLAKHIFNNDLAIDNVRLYISGKLPPFVWGNMSYVIRYICYHGHVIAAEKWLDRDIVKHIACIQHGILTNLDFAIYCLNRSNMMKVREIARTVANSLIMNNIVPDFDIDPYCIWYPHIPKESTCYELAKRYPKFSTLVGRVCAIAGYNELYDSLSIPADEATYMEAVAIGNTHVISKLKDMNRKFYMIDHTWYDRYFVNKPREKGIVHILGEVHKYYSITDIDEDSNLFDFNLENTGCLDNIPSIQSGMGVRENMNVLRKN